MSGRQLLQLALFVTHFLSIAVWVGVMLFNLIVNFPAVRSRARTPAEFAAAMAAQGMRAGPWLYALIALTALSGWGLHILRPASVYPLAQPILACKVAALALMLAIHLYGTFRLWPRIYFALDHEQPALFKRYQIAMAASAALGIIAITLSYLPRLA